MKLNNETIREAVKLWLEDEASATKKYGHIKDWDTSGVSLMNSLFRNARDFNNDIGLWNTSNVISMSLMFWNASSFNQNIGKWDVSNVTDMSGMFCHAESFNQDIGAWDVSNVTDFYIEMQHWQAGIFTNAYSFNQDIGKWDVSSITDMREMFSGATSFNQDIGSWDVSNVENMEGMFFKAESFNQDIGRWNVSCLRHMSYMFFKASSFNQNLSDWDISNIKDFSKVFSETAMPAEVQVSNADETQPKWLSAYFNKYISPEILKCKILKCRNQYNQEGDEELIFLKCLINGEEISYILRVYDEGCEGFDLYKGGKFDDDFESAKWEGITEHTEGNLFLSHFFQNQDINFHPSRQYERAELIEGMEFEIKKWNLKS